MRDIAFLPFFLCSLFVATRSRLAALLLWGWSGLVSIQMYPYGFMGSVPYGVIYAGLALALFFIVKDSESEKFQLDTVTFFLIAFGLHAIASSLLSPDHIWRKWEITWNIQKMILFVLLLPMVVTNRARVSVLVLVVCLSLAVQSALVGLKFIASAGSHSGHGNGKFGDRNDLATLTAMCLPLAFYAMHRARYHLMKMAMGTLLVLNILAVISTQSRSGFLAALVMGIYLGFRSRRKVLSVLLIAVIAVVAVVVAPTEWEQRMTTIGAAEKDDSFMQRINAWKRSSALAMDDPVFGGGIRSVQDHKIFLQYQGKEGFLGWVETPPAPTALAAHSIYFEVMGDLGFVGFGLFMLIMLSPFVLDRKIRRLAQQLGPSADWAKQLSLMLCSGMVAYLVGGAAISAAYFELGYIYVGCSISLLRLLQRQVDKAAQPSRVTV